MNARSWEQRTHSEWRCEEKKLHSHNRIQFTVERLTLGETKGVRAIGGFAIRTWPPVLLHIDTTVTATICL